MGYSRRFDRGSDRSVLNLYAIYTPDSPPWRAFFLDRRSGRAFFLDTTSILDTEPYIDIEFSSGIKVLNLQYILNSDIKSDVGEPLNQRVGIIVLKRA